MTPVERATQLGHTCVVDPPMGTSASRWTCVVCGRAVLVAGSNVYGSAITEPCPGPPDSDEDLTWEDVELRQHHDLDPDTNEAVREDSPPWDDE